MWPVRSNRREPIRRAVPKMLDEIQPPVATGDETA